MRPNFSLVASYSLKFTSCSLHVVKSLVTRCKICSLPPCKIRSLFVAEVTHCKKSLITHCKICSLLVVEIARYKKSHITCCKIRSLLVAKVKSLFAILLKRDSSTGIFLWIFAKFQKHLFCRTYANGCFWK